MIFGVLFVIYLLFGYRVTITNDSVTNINQIVALDVLNRSSHFTFHFFGIVSYLLLSKMIGLSAIISVEVMLAFFSAVGSISLFHVLFKKIGNYQQSLIAVLIYAFTSSVFRFSCQSEYLVLVPSLGLISLAFFSSSKFFISGIVFGFGLLTSPFIILYAPIFFLFTKMRDCFYRNHILLILGIILIYFGVNIFTYEQTLSGNWSYGQIFYGYLELVKEINLLRQLSIFIYGYLRSFNVLLFFIPSALLYSYQNNRKLFWIFLITLIFHLPAAIPEARYGGYQMTFYPLISILLSYYLINLFKKKRRFVHVIIFVFIALNIFVVANERAFFIDLKKTYCELNKDLKPGSVLFVYRATNPIKNVYAPNLNAINLLSDYQERLAEYETGYEKPSINSIISENEELYLLESGVSWPDDYIKLVFSKFTKSQGAKVKGFGLEKLNEYIKDFQIIKQNNYKLDVYKITK